MMALLLEELRFCVLWLCTIFMSRFQCDLVLLGVLPLSYHKLTNDKAVRSHVTSANWSS